MLSAGAKGLAPTGKGVIEHDWLPSIERTLRVATIVMMFAGYAALTTTPTFDSTLLALPLAVTLLMPLLEWADRSLRAYRLLSRLATLGILVMLPTVFLPLWGLLSTVTALVVYIQVYLMVHDKKELQYMQIFLMNFFLLITACVQSPDPAIGLLMVAFLMSAVFSFLLLQAWSELRLKREGEQLAHAGDEDARRSRARVVLLGRRPHGPADQRRGAPRSMAMVGSVLGISLACVALTVMVFVGTPRLEAGALGRSTNFNNMTIGLPDEVDFMGAGNLQRSGTAVMHVRFPDMPSGQYPGELLWRSTALDEYTGRGWGRIGVPGQYRTDPGAMAEHARDHEGGLVRTRLDRRGRDLVRQVIYMDAVPGEGVPVLPIVRRIMSPTGRFAWDDARDGTVVLPPGTPTGFQYEVVSDTALPSAEELRQAPDNYGDFLRFQEMVVLIAQDLRPESLALVEQLTANADNTYDKAVAIENYFQSGEFLYSLQVPPLPEQHPIDAFIHDVRSGHCELFASAMALMMRSLGVPTRVVKGYRGGDWNAEDESYTVLSDMAHLWVEVYFIGHGWMPFDPSPGGEEAELSTLAALNRMWSRTLLRGKMIWYQNVVGFETLWRLDDLRAWRVRAVPEVFSGVFGQRFHLPGTVPWQRYWPTIVGITGFFACAFILWRSSVGGHARQAFRVDLTPDQRRARHLFLRFEEQLRALGIPETAQGGSELLHALREKRASLAPQAATIVQAYQDARFGGRSLSRTRYAEMVRALRILRHAARKAD